ncbi:MAG: glutamate-1-semialdehyde 2,1-aminomutase, partial [Chlamydiota bacterium]
MLYSRPHTETIFKESSFRIPGGVSSPVRAFQGLNLTPLIVERGEGDTIVDVDGYSYIDYCMSWGSLALGHVHPSVKMAVQRQLEKGSSFGITTALESQMASEITSCMPSLEKIRFVSSGTEATMSALRLARGYTKRSYFIKFIGNYHGHADPFLVKAGSGVSFLPESSSLGVPEETIRYTISLPYNDAEAVKKAFSTYKDIAAVIVEPIAANMGVVPGTKEFLDTLRSETTKAGALLIFDEVITGFRVELNGAQGYYGIEPDLTCLGKIIGGGLPLAAFGGKREIMDLLSPLGGVYQAGTLSGNPLALAAGLATIKQLKVPLFYETLESKAKALLDPLLELINTRKSNVCIHRVGSFFTVFFGVKQVSCQEDLKGLDPFLFKQFYHYLFERGIYFSPAQQEACFISFSHSEESLQRTL